MKKYFKYRALSVVEPPALSDRRILSVAAFRAARVRRRRKIAGFSFAAAAALLVTGAGILFGNFNSGSPARRGGSTLRRAELLRMGDFSRMNQENYNLYWEAASQRQAVGELTASMSGKEI